MTSFGDAILALLVLIGLNLGVLRAVRARAPQDATEFLVRTYVATLTLRAVLALLLNVSLGEESTLAYFWGDSSQYDASGDLLAQYWRSDYTFLPGTALRVTGYGFAYVVGGFYYVFGRNQLLVQFVNCTIGSLAMLVIYAIARNLFDAEAGRWAARFMAYFPQMIFWSAGLYKDPAILLCIALCMYAVTRLREAFTPRLVALYLLSDIALITLRFYVFYMVTFATLSTFVFSQRRGLARGLLAQAALVAAFLAAFSFAASNETLERHASYFELSAVQTARSDQTNLGESRFEEEADVSTVAGALGILPVGLVYLLFAPFPWDLSGVRLLTFPETLVWYGLMPAFVRGLAHALRHKFRDCLPILAFTLLLTLAYAIFQGNVGTAYRQRTQITMFFFVFMGVGLAEKRRRQERAGAAARPAFRI